MNIPSSDPVVLRGAVGGNIHTNGLTYVRSDRHLAILQVAFTQADVHPLIVVAGTAAPLPDGAAGRAVAASAREDAAASVGDPQRGHAFEEEAAEAVVGDAPG